MNDISNSYYPVILEMRDTAVEKNEPLVVYNNRIVLTEIPDEFMKVYIGGYTEIEDSKFPKQGEFVVDYKTGIVTFGGEVKDKTVLSVSYYGLGIIQYPAQRIYSHSSNPDVAINLQEIINKGESALSELTALGDLAKHQLPISNVVFMGNQDWSPLAYITEGEAKPIYNEVQQSVLIDGEGKVFINTKIPVDKDGKYFVRVKVKKVIGDGSFSVGIVSLDNNYRNVGEEKTVIPTRTIKSGKTEILEGSICGFNVKNEAGNKLGEEAKYLNLVITANMGGIADITRTAIESLEIYRSQKTMHVENEGSFGGKVVIGGEIDAKSNIALNGNSIMGISSIQGQYGKIAESSDKWLKINSDNSHANGVLFGNSTVRTDGKLQIGSQGSTFNADEDLITYKGNNIGVADGTIQVNLNADKLDGFHESTFMRKNANSDLTFSTIPNGKSNGIKWAGSVDTHSMFVESSTTDGNTKLVILNTDNGTDHTVFRSNNGKTEKDLLLITSSSVESNNQVNVKNTLSVKDKATLKNDLEVIGTANLKSNVNVGGQLYTDGKAFIGKTSGTPTLTLAIGDSDTGVNWLENGHLEIKTDNIALLDLTTTKVDVNKKLNAKSSLSVTGNTDISENLNVDGTTSITGDSTIYGGLSVNGSTSLLNALEVEGIATFNNGISIGNKNINNVKLINVTEGLSWTEGTFKIDVNNDTRTNGKNKDTLHLYGTSGAIKLWRPTKIVGNTDVQGDIIVSGTVDGVDIAKLNTDFYNHNHDDRYISTNGATLTGSLTFTNKDAIILKSSGHKSVIQIHPSENSFMFAFSESIDGTDWDLSKYTKFDDNGNLIITGRLETNSIIEDGVRLSHKYLSQTGGTLKGDLIVADGVSIVPETKNGATLGSIDKPFADVFIGANSLYVDGKKVVSSESDTIDISTDVDQHLSISTSGLGTTRIASGKEVMLYSKQQVNLQSIGNISALSSGLISFKSDMLGSGIEFISQSAIGSIKFASRNDIQFSATGDINFVKRPLFNQSEFITFADNIDATRVTEDATHKFVTDIDKENWNGKLDSSGGTMTGFITLHADPTQPLHAVTKHYVDAIKESLDIKESVRVATTANITLNGGQTIDGVVLGIGNRVLVKDQTDAKQNGIYIVQSGAWIRAEDFDEDTDVTSGAFTFVEEGKVNAGMGFVLITSGAINIDITPLEFTQFSGAGQIINGEGLYKRGNEIGLTNIMTAGMYRSVTVNKQGRVIAGTNPTTISEYGITDALNKTGDTMTGILTLENMLMDERITTGNKQLLNANGQQIFVGNKLTGLMLESSTNPQVTVGSEVHTLYHSGNSGEGSGLDADTLDGIQGSVFVRNDQNNTINGKLTVDRIVGKQNGFTVVIPTGSTEVTLTHNFGHTNYCVALGTNSVNRHAGWKSKTENSIVIEIDDVYTSDIVIDVILMPIA